MIGDFARFVHNVSPDLRRQDGTEGIAILILFNHMATFWVH